MDKCEVLLPSLFQTPILKSGLYFPVVLNSDLVEVPCLSVVFRPFLISPYHSHLLQGINCKINNLYTSHGPRLCFPMNEIQYNIHSLSWKLVNKRTYSSIYSTILFNLDLKNNQIVDKGKFLFIELFQLINKWNLNTTILQILMINAFWNESQWLITQQKEK